MLLGDPLAVAKRGARDPQVAEMEAHTRRLPPTTGAFSGPSVESWSSPREEVTRQHSDRDSVDVARPKRRAHTWTT